MVGMLRAARAILDDYGTRAVIDKLSKEKFNIKIIGHSLGAGTSALLTAELKNGFMNDLNAGLISEIPPMMCLGYACPSVTSQGTYAFTDILTEL